LLNTAIESTAACCGHMHMARTWMRLSREDRLNLQKV